MMTITARPLFGQRQKLIQRHRADHVAATEFAIIDLVSGRLGQFVQVLRVAPWHHHVLIGDGDFLVGLGPAL